LYLKNIDKSDKYFKGTEQNDEKCQK